MTGRPDPPPMVQVSQEHRRRAAATICRWAVKTYPGDHLLQVLEARSMCEIFGLIPATPVGLSGKDSQ